MGRSAKVWVWAVSNCPDGRRRHLSSSPRLMRGRRSELNHGISRDTWSWCEKPTLEGIYYDQSHSLPPPLASITKLLGTQGQIWAQIVGGTQFKPTPKCPQSLTNHWYVGRTELLGTEGQMEFPNYWPTYRGWHLKSTEWYPWPIRDPPKKATICKRKWKFFKSLLFNSGIFLTWRWWSVLSS